MIDHEIPEGIEVPDQDEYVGRSLNGIGRRAQRNEDRARAMLRSSCRTVAGPTGAPVETPVTWTRQLLHVGLEENRKPRFTISTPAVLADQHRADEQRRHRIDAKRPRLIRAMALREVNAAREARQRAAKAKAKRFTRPEAEAAQ